MKRLFVLLLVYLAVSSCVTKKKFESTVSQYEAQDSVQNTLITQLQDSIVSIQEDSVFVERTVVEADTHEIRVSLKLLCDSTLMAKNAEIVNLKSKSVAVTVQDGTIVVKGFTQEQVNERVFESKKELNQTFQFKLDSVTNYHKAEIDSLQSQLSDVTKSPWYCLPPWLTLTMFISLVASLLWVFNLIMK